MDEILLKHKIKGAYPPITVPVDLIECTIQRGKAILWGREAEKNIEAGKETKEDVSAAISGRLMLLKEMPNGISANALKTSIKKLPSFKGFCMKPCEEQLESLRSGKFLSELSLENNTAKASVERKKPQKEVISPQL